MNSVYKNKIIICSVLILILTLMFSLNVVSANNDNAIKKVETKQETTKETEKETQKEETSKETQAETDKETTKEVVKDRSENKIIENVDQFGTKFGNMPSRQFMQIQTKNNTVLYLLIDYTDVGQEIKLLTEVTDKDIINMAIPELQDELKKQVQNNIQPKEEEINSKDEIIEKEEMVDKEQIDTNERGNGNIPIKYIVMTILLICATIYMIFNLIKRKSRNADYDE